MVRSREYSGRNNPRVWYYNGVPCEVSPIADPIEKKVTVLRVTVPGSKSIVVECGEDGTFPGVTYDSN